MGGCWRLPQRSTAAASSPRGLRPVPVLRFPHQRHTHPTTFCPMQTGRVRLPSDRKWQACHGCTRGSLYSCPTGTQQPRCITWHSCKTHVGVPRGTGSFTWPLDHVHQRSTCGDRVTISCASTCPHHVPHLPMWRRHVRLRGASDTSGSASAERPQVRPLTTPIPCGGQT